LCCEGEERRNQGDDENSWVCRPPCHLSEKIPSRERGDAEPTGSAGVRPTRLGVNPKSAPDRHERKFYRRPKQALTYESHDSVTRGAPSEGSVCHRSPRQVSNHHDRHPVLSRCVGVWFVKPVRHPAIDLDSPCCAADCLLWVWS
jgi:hypothetical protein